LALECDRDIDRDPWWTPPRRGDVSGALLGALLIRSSLEAALCVATAVAVVTLAFAYRDVAGRIGSR